ncbi:con-10 family general stress protein [Gluconacetobacter azotocaptans]|nr:general stress protein [Gluconacetobacter azotocaptans]
MSPSRSDRLGFFLIERPDGNEEHHKNHNNINVFSRRTIMIDRICIPHIHASAMAPADSRGGGGKEHNPGNFANNPEKASEAGHKSGQHRSGHAAEEPAKASESGHTGGQHRSGNFADDPERAAEAGRKGGQHSHDKK